MKKTEKRERSLQDRSWDLLAEMWLNEEADKILREIEEEKAEGKTAEMDAFLAQYDAKAFRLIEKGTERAQRRRLFKQTLPRIGRIAAMWIAAAVLAGGAAVAASQTVRVYLTKLLIETTAEYTSLQVVEDGEVYIDVPAEWNGEYFPSVVPEGLVLRDVDTHWTTVTYTFPENSVVQFQYSETTDATVNIDSEDAVIKPVQIWGCEGTMIIKEDRIHTYWFDGKTLFELFVRGHSEEEAITYIDGLQKIK